MDATRVFLNSGQWFWPKAGGSAAPFIPRGLGEQLTLNGGTYYWSDLGSRAVNITDASGALVRSIPVANPVNGPAQLLPAGDAGVYVLTRCFSTSDRTCPASTTDTIELIHDAASDAQTVVTPAPSTMIDAIAAAGNVLIWAERNPTDASEQIQQRDATTGAITALVTLPEPLATRSGGLVIAGDAFFDAIDFFSRIERRALADGALLDSYAVEGTSAEWLTYDTDLYYTQQPTFSIGPEGQCPVPLGVSRIRVSDRSMKRIDANALSAPVLIDGDVLYYTDLEISMCCSGNGHECPPSRPAPSHVRCYRLR
ncbi:MAG TPA: hypothetical protein VF516_35945 [Kofleriaceae bacterium]